MILRGLPHGLSPGLAVTLRSGPCLLPQLLLLKWELNKSTSSWGLYVGSVRSQMQVVKCCPGSCLGWTWQLWELLAALLIFCQNSPGLAVSQSPASCLLFLHVLVFALGVSHGPRALPTGRRRFRPPQSLSSPGILAAVNNRQPYGLTHLTGKKTEALEAVACS